MSGTKQQTPALTFRSTSGQKYLFDDPSGLIFPNEEHLLAKLYSTGSQYLEIDRSRPSGQPDVIAAEIAAHIEKNGFNQLTLELTGACNFRCAYCVYGDHYPATRMLNSRNMSFETAKKAIDYYMGQVAKKRQINPNAFPTVGFYGGEPLLQFPLLQEIVHYIDREYAFFPKKVYTITTNGFLLTHHAADFLAEHDFSIIVSLDGDEKNHDRNRVTADNQGTFKTVYGNIQQFRKRYPDYAKFGISACYDYRTDLFAMRDFFQKEDLFIVKLSQVSGTNTDYYTLFSDEEEKRFREQYESLRQDFFISAQKGVLAADSFLFPLFGTAYAEFTFHSMIRERRLLFSPYTAACIPGDKIYVTADGLFHICERVPHDMPIGDVDHGLHFQTIAEIISSYNSQICGQCSSCRITKLCGLCYATVSKDHGFHHVKGYCQAMEQYCGKMLADLTSLLENNPTLMEQVTVDYYQAVIDTAGYIIE